MKIRLFVLALCVFLGFAPAFAYDGLGPQDKGYDVQSQAFVIVNHHWAITEMLLKLQETPNDEAAIAKYNQELEIYKKQSVELGKRILNSLEEKNRDVITIVSDIYKSLEAGARPALFTTLGYLRASILQEGKISEAEFREYFPGYGYTEPGYKYRKGREVAREFKGNSWQWEEQTIQSTFQVELTVTLDILAMLKNWLTGGIISKLEVGQQYETNVNGTPMLVRKVSFSVVKTLTTKTNRKFEVNKVWFELMRAKSSGFSTGPWEVVGKTYEILSEPTGEEVTTEINQKP